MNQFGNIHGYYVLCMITHIFDWPPNDPFSSYMEESGKMQQSASQELLSGAEHERGGKGNPPRSRATREQDCTLLE